MVSGAFAAVLTARRSEFNARAAEARRRYPGFDQEAFGRFLVDSVDPLVQEVAALEPGREADVACIAYGLALELVGLRLADGSPRTRALSVAWRGVLPAYAALLARQPEPVIGTLSNAVLHLDALGGVRTEQWGREMAALAPCVSTLAELRALGQILAWRAGAAHYRHGAVAAADGLPEALTLAAFGAAHARSWRQLREELARDPWWCAPGDIFVSHRRSVGAFAGFGGLFADPPRVSSGVDEFFVRSGKKDFVLHADAYGATLLPAGAGQFDAAARSGTAPTHAVHGSELLLGQQRIALQLPGDRLAVCATGATVAISSPYSHAITLVPRK